MLLAARRTNGGKREEISWQRASEAAEQTGSLDVRANAAKMTFCSAGQEK